MGILNSFIIPLIQVTFLLGIISFVVIVVYIAFRNAWRKQTKFYFRYKFPLFKKPYPEKLLKWILDCFDRGIGYYDAKKLLMVKMVPDNEIYEILWIYDQVINELNKQKGGLKNGGKFERCNSKIEATAELPQFTG